LAVSRGHAKNQVAKKKLKKMAFSATDFDFGLSISPKVDQDK